MWLKIKVSWHDVPFLLFCFPPQIPSHDCIYFAESTFILFLYYYFVPSMNRKTSINISSVTEVFFWTLHRNVHFTVTAAIYIYRIYLVWLGGWEGVLNAVWFLTAIIGLFMCLFVRFELNLNSVLGCGWRYLWIWSYFSANNGHICRT